MPSHVIIFACSPLLLSPHWQHWSSQLSPRGLLLEHIDFMLSSFWYLPFSCWFTWRQDISVPEVAVVCQCPQRCSGSQHKPPEIYTAELQCINKTQIPLTEQVLSQITAGQCRVFDLRGVTGGNKVQGSVSGDCGHSSQSCPAVALILAGLACSLPWSNETPQGQLQVLWMFSLRQTHSPAMTAIPKKGS